ncbi:hypothetical protein KOW79_004759 [Hemibagrus wyckioides]|uniref:Uncharacterized protein n=1 Tax=Hemibagrus wyckioides TaxID=337641 RepID=A0A9D3NXN6_9TELE|nr:hypothetical protein KOW79_004759 [Hemibagrus wyckioides]
MACDPIHDYSHKELAKILGSLAHNLLLQAKGGETSISRLEQESTALKIQAGEARRNLEIAHGQLDQLTTEMEHRHQMAGEQQPELQEEVVKLQTALAELQVNTAQREQQEKGMREELSEELQQAKGLLKRAEAELRERDAKDMAYEGHLQTEGIGATAVHGPNIMPDTPVDPETTQGGEPPGTTGDGPWEDDIHQHEPQGLTVNSITFLKMVQKSPGTDDQWHKIWKLHLRQQKS